MTMAPSTGGDQQDHDRNGQQGHGRTNRTNASWREVAKWYPWLVPVLGLLAAGGAVWLFAAIAEQVYDNGLILGLDRRLLGFVESIRTPTLVAVFGVITFLGEGAVVVAAAALTAILLGITTHSWRPVIMLALTSLTTSTSVFLIKLTIARQRPIPAPNAATEDGFAFPSGHSAHAAAVYLMIAFLIVGVTRTRTARVAITLAAVLVVGITGFSRLVLGVHSPSDVLAGWLLGAAFTVTIISLVQLSARTAPFRGWLVERARDRRSET